MKNPDLEIFKLCQKIRRYKLLTASAFVTTRLVELQEQLRQTPIKQRCDTLLIALMGADRAESWWNSPNQAFDMRTGSAEFELAPESVYDYLLFYSYVY